MSKDQQLPLAIMLSLVLLLLRLFTLYLLLQFSLLTNTVVRDDSITMNSNSSTVVIYHSTNIRPASSRQETPKLQAFDGG